MLINCLTVRRRLPGAAAESQRKYAYVTVMGWIYTYQFSQYRHSLKVCMQTAPGIYWRWYVSGILLLRVVRIYSQMLAEAILVH